jgi:hypothetical protein
MTLSPSTVESLFRQGRFDEIAADAADNLREALRNASVEHQMLLAESLARVGKLALM